VKRYDARMISAPAQHFTAYALDTPQSPRKDPNLRRRAAMRYALKVRCADAAMLRAARGSEAHHTRRTRTRVMLREREIVERSAA